jgi:hypothetical protein
VPGIATSPQRVRQVAAVAVFALVAAGGFSVSSVHALREAPPGYVLKWSDDFDGPAGPIDTGRWNYRTDCKLASAQLPSNVTLDGAGNARIALSKNTNTCNSKNYDYSGGGLISKSAFRYGYYEVRIKGSTAPNWHTAFWLIAGDGTSTFGIKNTTEIDAPEWESQLRNRIDYNIHGWTSSGYENSYYVGMVGMVPPKLPSSFDNAAWHVYGIGWLENSVAMYVDGALEWTAPYRQNDWIHNRLNIWLTSIAVDGADAGLPDMVLIDYVRFYERDIYVDTQDSSGQSTDPGTYAEVGSWATSTLMTPLYTPAIGSAVDGSGAPLPASWYGYSYSTSRYTSTAGDVATWTPTIDATQDYRVLLWNVVAPNGDPAATVDVNAETSGSTIIDQTTGTSGWVDLGTFTFAAGATGNVALTSSGTGSARANTVKFVPESGPVQ